MKTQGYQASVSRKQAAAGQALYQGQAGGTVFIYID